MEKNKYSDNKHGEFGNFRPEVHVAYHFDAVKFAIWLRDNYAMKRGVKHLKAEIKDVKVDSDGVSELVLDDGTSVIADLYVDCSGFKSMLLEGALGEPFIDYSHTLPNNRAWAVQIPYTDKDKELQPFTTSTALGNGWVWNTPSWSRIGTGYVYSDKYITPEDALQEFKNHLNSENMVVPNKNRVTEELKFRELTFKPGIHKRVWVKNVVAIGLSAGFIEPLEATSIWVTIEQLNTLSYFFNDMFSKNEDNISLYNEINGNSLDKILNFMYLHYITKRKDSEFWMNIKNYIPPNNFEKKLKLIKDNSMNVFEFKDNKNMASFQLTSFLEVCNGLEMFEKSINLDYYDNMYQTIEEYKQSIDPAWIADAALAVAVIPTLISLLINADTTDPDPS
jgi:tryptophan halogenase